MSDYSFTLSTTEPNNYVGLIKLRQGDVASQSIKATITANGQLFKFDGLSVFFNAVLPNGNVIRDKVTEVDYFNSKLNYVVADSFLQEVAQISAWFSFENVDKIIDSTKNFQYSVIAGWKECIPQGNYIYELSEIQREIEEIIGNKDFTSLISKISSIEQKYNELINETTAQLAQKVGKNATDLSISMFNENDRNVLQGQEPGTINAVLGEGNVHPENTNFLYPSPQNIYNYETNEDGIRLGFNGDKVVDANYSTSQYIKVTPGTYTIGFPEPGSHAAIVRVPFYNNEKVFQSIILEVDPFPSYRVKEITILETGYIRVPVLSSKRNMLVLAKSSDYDGFHKFSWVQDIKSTPKVNSVGIDELKIESVDEARTTFLSKSLNNLNKFNKKDILKDSFYAIPPSTIFLDGYFTIKEPIFLTQGTYTIQKVRQWALYSTSGIQLSFENTNDNNANVTFTATEDILLYMSGSIDNLDLTQVEEGSVATKVSEYGYNFKALQFTKEQIESLKTEIENEEQDKDIKVIKKGEIFTLISDFSDYEKISIITERHSARNKAFNFVRTEVNGVKIHDNPDDITPIRTFTTVGANHGYTTIAIVTMVSHGKNVADLGSKWTDGTTVYTLLLINGNDLTFGCPYTLDSNSIPSSVITLPASDLTHVSGAINTTEVNISTTNTGQLFPSINKITVKYILDGKEIKEDGIYYGEKLQVIEKYNVMDYKSIIDYAQNNIGTSYANDSIEGIVQISNTFTFTKGLKNTTSHGLKALKNVLLAKCGFLQAVPINLSGHTRKRFMPNVKIKSGFDFETGVNLDTYSTNLVFANSDNKKVGVPPNHVIDWLYDSSGNKKYGFTIGYIPDKTNSKNSDRTANTPNTWDMRSTKKLYPIAVEGKLLLAGDYMNFEGYRNYLTAEEVGEATNFNVVRDNKDTYVFVDFNKQVKWVSKELNNDIGKDVVNVQSENVELKNDVVDSNGVVISTTAGISNGIFKAK